MASARRSAKKFSLVSKTFGLTDNEVADCLRRGRDGFTRSHEWAVLRKEVLSRYGGKCMKCGIVPNKGVNVDHIKPRKTHPELALAFDNLQVLCGPCNKRKGNRHMTDYRLR